MLSQLLSRNNHRFADKSIKNQEDFTNKSYTLTLTASDGTSKTLKSSKRK
jgi:hypothetical protein